MVKTIQKLLTKRNQFLLFLLTFLFALAAIYDTVTDFFPEPVSITIYVFAAGGFVLSCTLWIKAIVIFINMVFLPFTRENKYMNTLIKNEQLRTVVLTLPGMGLNLIYAVFNGVIGITDHSAWYGSLSAYYILLCAMRFTAVFSVNKFHIEQQGHMHCFGEVSKREWNVYKKCGYMLSVLSVALCGAVIMLVTGEGGKKYSGLLIYAVATYTFYKFIMAVIHVVKNRKEKSALMLTLRNISYADAIVSMLSLQSALFHAFGQNAGELIPIMNGITGGIVCIAVFTLGRYMVYNANRRKDQNSQTE